MIDMHAHWRPAELADALRARTAEPRIVRNHDGAEVLKTRMGEEPLATAFDQADFHLARMDRQGVSTSVLSLLGSFCWIEAQPLDVSLPLCRLFNDSVSKLCQQHPGRFAAYAALPLVDIAAAAVASGIGLTVLPTFYAHGGFGGQPLADKIVLMLFLASFYGLIVFIPMDVFRLHLMGSPGLLVSSLGLFLFLAGWGIVFLALRENTFAAPVVRLQEERKQRVVDTGVYGVVRHPMYAGGILFIVGIPLWLESYAGVLLALVPIGTLVLRIRLEEQFLRRELKGYDAYTKRVRYRLVPFLW